MLRMKCFALLAAERQNGLKLRYGLQCQNPTARRSAPPGPALAQGVVLSLICPSLNSRRQRCDMLWFTSNARAASAIDTSCSSPPDGGQFQLLS